LGAQLLDRSTMRVELTEKGRQYFAACRSILDDLSEAERAVTDESLTPRGELVVAAPIVFGRLHVVPVVAAFLQAHSEVEVELRQSDRMVNLAGEGVDLAVRIGELSDSNHLATRVGSANCDAPEAIAM
jgi:DNA-binding transcriptional LysR family regulator